MLRKLNFTERAKLPKTSIRVSLRRDADGVLVFDPQLSFDAVSLVPMARIFIEASYRTSFMRFDCGSVENFVPPDDRRLTEIDATSVVRFRVKIVDNSANDHRIIAVADDIVVSEQKTEGGGRMPLLPVSFTDALGQQPWRLAFEPNGPVLELNNRIDDVQNVAKNDAVFFALVYPAAVREILTHILLIEGRDALEEGAEWWNLWLRWAGRYSTDSFPKDDDESRFWIDEVVAGFCRDQRTLDRWRAARTERS